MVKKSLSVKRNYFTENIFFLLGKKKDGREVIKR